MTHYLTSVFSQVSSVILNDIPQIADKRVAFITTAAEPYAEKEPKWLLDDKKPLIEAAGELIPYTLTGKSWKDLKKDLSLVDILFFSGGNSYYLLEKMYQSGLDQILPDLLKEKTYIGSSAGSVVAGPNIDYIQHLDDKSKAPDLKSTRSLNLINVYLLPHWGKEKYKKSYQKVLDAAYQKSYSVLPLPDDRFVRLTNQSFKLL